MAITVSPDKVIPRNYAPIHTIRRMRKILQKQGQIEPLQVKANSNGTFTTFELDVWGSEIVYAARELNWPTLLVVEMTKYEF